MLNSELLHHAVLDYFADIIRLKLVHNISYVNEIKINSYGAYWILRRKPIQIISNEIPDNMVELISFVNERYVLSVILRFLADKDIEQPLLQEVRSDYKSFVDALLYYMKYRKYDSQSLEMIILSYNAEENFNILLII
jgi:hypothetical protein